MQLKSTFKIPFCFFCFQLLMFLGLMPLSGQAQQDEFYGPFPSWTNLKTVYRAAGDGKKDDTKAIQKALDELGVAGHSNVLYIPAGTYRLTATLTMMSKKGIAIIGEDPENTTIRWDGPAGQNMFFLNGVSYSEYSRLTWDGNQKASAAYAHEWDGKVPLANSGSQHSDEQFKNLQVGIKSGAHMDAEMSIRRCRFYSCSSTAISLQGANALDWWIWDCYFENCNTGVANNLPAFGAGNFNVYRCIFNHSLVSDISLGNSNFFSFRDNVSYNSTAFLKAAQFSNTSPITIQNNTIISNSNNVLVDLFTKGNVLLMGNRFITPDSGKNYIIRNVNNFKGSTPDITFLNNSFTATKKIIEYGNGKIIESGTQTGVSLKTILPIKPYPFAAVKKYPVIEVSDTIQTGNLQNLFNQLSVKKATTIVHLRQGNYRLTQPLILPVGLAIILVGDGLQTNISYPSVDTISAAVLTIQSPVRCVIKNISILGNKNKDGIRIVEADKPGNSIYSNQLMLFNGVVSNATVKGLANTSVRFENFQHNYCAKGNSVNIIGNGTDNNPLVRIFGCESAVNDNSYTVDKGGRLVVYDAWYEGNSRQFLQLKGKGGFYLNGAKVAVTGNTNNPFISVDKFNGDVVITQAIYNSQGKKIYFNNTFRQAKLLLLGTLSWTDSTNKVYEITGGDKAFYALNNRYNLGAGSFPLVNSGTPANDELIRLLTPILTTSVQKDKTPIFSSSQIILDRVMVDGARNNLFITKAGEDH